MSTTTFVRHREAARPGTFTLGYAGIPNGSPVVAPDARLETRKTSGTGSLPLIRACAACESEFGLLDRSDARKTHGVCRRHFRELLEQSGLGEVAITTEMAGMRAEAFCPDLEELLPC